MIAQHSSTRLIPVKTLPAADGRCAKMTHAQMHTGLVGLLSHFAPISLAEMDGVALQDRTDTKFVFHSDQLLSMLDALAGQYRVLEIDGVRLQRYRTLYFDTDDFALFRLHHARRRNRYKVRSRRYEESGRACFEIKRKTSADRTVKERLWTPHLICEVTPEVRDFLREHLPSDVSALQPRLWNTFGRITLVGLQRLERVTIDVGLRFRRDQHIVVLPGVVIAEVKQAGHDRNSDVIRLMRAARIRPRGFSKYCIGVSLLYTDVKQNNFKPTCRFLHTLMHGDTYVAC